MSTTARALVVAGLAAALVPAMTAPADAAPRQKGTTTVAPSPLTASVLQGLTGPAALTADGAVFGIVGGSRDGVVKHVGGIVVAELNAATPATSLELSNFWIDTRSATVSAIVNDSVRAPVFAVGAGGVLTFTETASAAVTGSPTAIAGLVAGVATVRPAA
jgi:hypothetical protein